MNTVLVWMLIAISAGSRSSGVTTVVGHFADEQQCSHVIAAMVQMREPVALRCIQARVVK